MKRTLGIDIDGTLASYDGTFVPGRIGDPIDGSIDALKQLREQYTVIAYTTRDLNDVYKWLGQHNMEVDGCEEKPIMYLQIDDRVIQFDGNWSKMLKSIAEFKPWYK